VPGHPVYLTLDSDINLRLPNGKRFGVGAIPFGGEGRKVDGGPMVPGPWAFTYGLATVIDDRPDLRKAERDADVLVDEGTVLSIDTKLYKVRIVRREFIELDPVM
jgi:hypothetical protein